MARGVQRLRQGLGSKSATKQAWNSVGLRMLFPSLPFLVSALADLGAEEWHRATPLDFRAGPPIHRRI